jgi:predicted DNA-binding protein (UPF0278 family)
MQKENDTPTSVFKAFIIAWQKGDTETMKSTLSGSTLQQIEKVSVAQKKSFNDSVIPNGHKILGHLIAETSPNTRNEKIGGEVAYIEAKNSLRNEFDSFVFLRENNVWKLALDCEVLDVIEIDTNVFEKLVSYLRNFFRNFLKV